MKKLLPRALNSLILLLIAVSPMHLPAQNIFSGEPVQWVGRPNDYSVEPYNTDYRTMSYRRISTTTANPADGRGQWVTTINVQNAGGDISPDNMPGGNDSGWLLISGPDGNRFQNKWNFNAVAQATMNTVNNVNWQGSNDMGLNMSAPGYYTLVMRDAGYANSEVFVAYTANEPVSVTRSSESFSGGQTIVGITTSAAPSANERIFVRYRSGLNDFTAATGIVEATGAGTTWSATLPAQECGTPLYYYVFSSTMTLGELNADSETNRSLAALMVDDNDGANYASQSSAATASVLSGTQSICGPGTATLSVAITGGTAPFTVVLSDGEEELVINDYQSGDDITVTLSETTSYSITSVTGADGCAGENNSGTATVTVEEGELFYADNDADGFGDPENTVYSCDGRPSGYVRNDLDCDDNLMLFEDLDGDGFGSETFVACDGVTNSDDCDDNLWVYEDNDYDGFGDPNVLVPCLENGVLNADDCDDTQILYSDEDGDGFGSNTVVACDGVPNTDDCDDTLWYYLDVDNDGFGSNILAACDGEGVLNNDDCDDNLLLFEDLDGDGYGSEVFAACEGVPNSDDCDDSDPELALQGGTFYQDLDGDGYGNPDVYLFQCFQPEGYVLYGIDCDDTDPEVVGGTLYWRDLDGDGYGDPLWPLGSCTGQPEGYVLDNTDCDDSNALINPGNTEVLNGKDDDCDGLIDEGFPTVVAEILPESCGTTLDDIDQYVWASLVAGAEGYQWRVTTLTGPNAGQVQIRNTALRVLKLSWLDDFAYETTYQVEVAVYYQGILFPYPAGANCTVTTPSETTALVDCEHMATSNNEQIHCGIVKYATGYRFRITDVNNPANTQDLDRPLRSFKLSQVTAFPVMPGSTYNVEIAVRNIDGTYMPFGDLCTVTTPMLGREKTPEFTAVAYPNPFVSEVGIDVTVASKGSATIKVYDMAGRIIDNIQHEINGRETILFGENYPAGVYNVVVTVADETKALRIIKR